MQPEVAAARFAERPKRDGVRRGRGAGYREPSPCSAVVRTLGGSPLDPGRDGGATRHETGVTRCFHAARFEASQSRESGTVDAAACWLGAGRCSWLGWMKSLTDAGG